MKIVGVFASAEEAVSNAHGEVSKRLGTALAQVGLTLLYGGGKNGLMSRLARAAVQHGGEVISIIPGEVKHKDLWFDQIFLPIVVKIFVNSMSWFIATADGFP